MPALETALLRLWRQIINRLC